MVAAPVNPSDYGTLKRDLKPDDKWTPAPIGNEGSGIVVASGGGVFANALVGLSVGFVGAKNQGAWSELN